MSHAPRDPDILIQFGYEIPERTQLISDIVRAGAQVTGLKVAQFISGDRHRAVVVPRQAAMWIAYHSTLRSLPEIGRRFGLSSLATVHKHLTNLQEKGFIKRAWNRSRSVEMIPTRSGGRAVLASW